MSRFYIDKIPVDFLTSQSALEKAAAFLLSPAGQKKNKPCQIVTLNSIMFNHTYYDRELFTSIQSAPLVLPDSIGIVIAGFLLGAKKTGVQLSRIPGIDFMMNICGFAQKNNLSVFLLGAKPEVIPETAIALKNKFPELHIAGFFHGYFNEKTEKEIIREINRKKPDILFVGFDVPRQEKWIYRNLPKLDVRVVMGVGGSFDVISGKLKRAPALMRAAGLEWLFRLIQEPWRIVRIKDLPVFFVKIIKLRLSPC